MSFVAVEFGEKANASYILGYLRIPEDFPPTWHLGFRRYLKDKYKISGQLKIYPLPVHQNQNTLTINPVGYKNMEDDFNLAIQSTKYYPICDETDAIRRSYSKLDLMSADYKEKRRGVRNYL